MRFDVAKEEIVKKYTYARDNGFFPDNTQWRIIFEKGTHHVITWDVCTDERIDNFSGHYESCLDYVEKRYIADLESLI